MAGGSSRGRGRAAGRHGVPGLRREPGRDRPRASDRAASRWGPRWPSASRASWPPRPGGPPASIWSAAIAAQLDGLEVWQADTCTHCADGIPVVPAGRHGASSGGGGMGGLSEVRERMAAAAERCWSRPDRDHSGGGHQDRQPRVRSWLRPSKASATSARTGPTASPQGLRCCPDARWHMIGRLQGNKVKKVRAAAALLHSLDRPELADYWARGDRSAPAGPGPGERGGGPRQGRGHPRGSSGAGGRGRRPGPRGARADDDPPDDLRSRRVPASLPGPGRSARAPGERSPRL